MSAASKARRENPDLEIIVFERGSWASYGACGLPYYIKGDIKNIKDLIGIPPEIFIEKRNIDLRLNHEVIKIIPETLYSKIFFGNKILDSFLGALIGGVAAGNPVNSYVIGSELLSQGVSLVAVVAFIISWVTVGVIQLPAEAMLLGKRFALVRNLISFVFAIVISILTVLLLQLL